MKHLKLLFLTITAAFVLNSCNSEDDTGSPAKEIKSESISFLYKGISYHSTYKISPDSVVIWDDSEVGKLYEKLDQLPELATLINKDGIIAFFDNSKELDDHLSLNDANKLQTRAAHWIENVDAKLWIYEHDRRKGAAFRFDLLKGGYNYHDDYGRPWFQPIVDISIPKLSIINFEDRISSLYFICTPAEFSLHLYEHPDYKGKSLYLANLFYEFYIEDMKDYTLKSGSLFSLRKTWNDEVSSLKVIFNGTINPRRLPLY